jgi:uncharacterized caspase-like protein
VLRVSLSEVAVLVFPRACNFGAEAAARGMGRRAFAAALLALAAVLVPCIRSPDAAPPSPVFLLEIPAFRLAPTDRPEIAIPSSNASELLIHLLRPAADGVDYGQIFPSINGESAATVSEFTSGERGKLIRVALRKRSEIRLGPGRNTVEIRANSRKGRVYYASFVLRTETDNRNQDLIYSVQLGGDAAQQVPPELILLEPERAIELRGLSSVRVRIAGAASAASSVAQVTVNGDGVALKRGGPMAGKCLGVAFEANRVEFDTSYTVMRGMTEIAVEAVDTSRNKTRLSIPVVTSEARPAVAFRGKKYALIVGISHFRGRDQGLRDLRFAEVDARSIYAFLRSPSGGRFLDDDILLLTNEQATLARIREALTGFVTRAGPDDMLFVFFASHGGSDPFAEQNLYFLAHDSDTLRMDQTAIGMKELRTLLQQNVRAKRLVLLIDACHSAGLTESPRELLHEPRNNLVSLYAERLLYAEEGQAVITSSDVNESAMEGQRWGGGHGVFTYWVLEGLKGQADANGDHLVTAGELFRFVRQRVRCDTQFQQNPRILAATNDDLALAVTQGRR